MGGRGSSSGLSINNNKYGSQYHMILESGNIKFVSKNNRQSEDLFETMTRGRVYVIVGGNDIIRITYFDNDLKRNKTIDFKHAHEGMKPHTHHGYEHNELDSKKGAAHLTTEEKNMVERVKAIWYDYLGRK